MHPSKPASTEAHAASASLPRCGDRASASGAAHRGFAERSAAEISAAGLRAEPRRLLQGELTFVSPEAQVQRQAELLGAGALVVTVAAPDADMRGRLAEHIDEHVERELAAQGAPSPYLAAYTAGPGDARARLSDQLFRARTLGATGIAVALASLRSLARPALSPEDSATLRTLAAATVQAPVVVLLDDGDTSLEGYAAPVALDTLLQTDAITRLTTTVAPILPTPPAPFDAPAELEGAPVTERQAEDHAERVASAPELPPVATPRELPETAVAIEPTATRVRRKAPDVREGGPFPERAGSRDTESVDAAQTRPPRRPGPSRDERSVMASVPAAGPNDSWRAWALQLGAARGPQPLAAFEKLFTESYMPLAGAIAAGLEDARALRAYDEFRRAFERAYTDAFATFALTARRPRLVMDAYDIASKLARLHNARGSHVLVVDSLRYDLGCLVRDAIARRAREAISLTSETLLWSALPTTTFRQLETLARGIDALRAPAHEELVESLRGKASETVRRLRVGSRELYKLDYAAGVLGSLDDREVRGSPEVVMSTFDDIAEGCVDSILRHVDTISSRTLVLVVGDHGFCIDRRGRMTSGGAAPEEVLVPALAYLVGDLH